MHTTPSARTRRKFTPRFAQRTPLRRWRMRFSRTPGIVHRPSRPRTWLRCAPYTRRSRCPGAHTSSPRLAPLRGRSSMLAGIPRPETTVAWQRMHGSNGHVTASAWTHSVSEPFHGGNHSADDLANNRRRKRQSASEFTCQASCLAPRRLLPGGFSRRGATRAIAAGTDTPRPEVCCVVAERFGA